MHVWTQPTAMGLVYGGPRLNHARPSSPSLLTWSKQGLTLFIYILVRLFGVNLTSQKSSKEKGTMYHCHNLINRASDPEKNTNAAEDFMLLPLHTHIVTATEVIQL